MLLLMLLLLLFELVGVSISLLGVWRTGSFIRDISAGDWIDAATAATEFACAIKCRRRNRISRVFFLFAIGLRCYLHSIPSDCPWRWLWELLKCCSNLSLLLLIRLDFRCCLRQLLKQLDLICFDLGDCCRRRLWNYPIARKGWLEITGRELFELF